MTGPGDGDAERLIDAARRAREHAYAPYSGFEVGAAVLDAEGRVFPGANMENASYPQSICAERNAVTRATSEGARRLVAVAVATPGPEPSWPCGGCRQVLHEFGPEMRVIVDAPGGRAERSLAELLPEAFGPDDLVDR